MSVLLTLDLPTIFRCAVELAEAAAAVDPAEWAALPVDIEGPASPHFERWKERHRRLRCIEEEAQRLKRSLGATGPLGHAEGETDAAPKWKNYDQHFSNCTHDRVVRLALVKLATAAIDLSGFATWREWQWPMRETGLRLLAWGLAQLWEGMSPKERAAVRGCLPRIHKAIGWPGDSTTDPPAYEGPEEIPLPDQYRIIGNYISCYRNYLDDVLKADNMRVEQGQERFLRRATLVQFVETAERPAQALQAMAKRDFDTPAEWGELYTKAFWPLACLRRAREIQPREAWPVAAMEQRKVLANAADILLTCVGGTPEAKASLKPADADKAFEEFTKATSQLRNAIEGRFIEGLLAGPDDVELSPREMALASADTNPYLTLRRVLRDLFWLAAEGRQGREVFDRINATTDPWDGAEARARGSSAEWGVPFTTFDPILTEAKRTMRELVQVAGGNTFVPFCATDARYPLLEERLQELANSVPASAGEAKSKTDAAEKRSEATPAAASGTDATLALMRVFTNGIADDRIEKATRLLADDKLTVNEKLTKIDALIPFPATASAEQLGEMLGVTKQAVLKTDWWIQNRKGEKESEVGRRREGHRKRAKSYESPGQDDDE